MKNKHLSVAFSVAAALLFAVSARYLFVSLSLVNQIHPTSGSVHLSPGFYYGLAGVNFFNLFGLGLVSAFSLVGTAVFAYLALTPESEKDELFTVNRY
jgi:hypothetical protein